MTTTELRSSLPLMGVGAELFTEGPTMAEKTERPIHEVRFGRIKAAVWANQTQAGVRHSVTFVRLYKEGDEWKTSASFGRDDLPLIAKVADKAHDWIFEHGGGSSE